MLVWLSERGSADRNSRDLDVGQEPAQFKVEVLPVHIVVPGQFGMDVGEQRLA